MGGVHHIGSRGDSLQKIVTRQHRHDVIVAALGLLVLFVASAMLISLLVDLVIDGLPRLISPEFYTNFPSRKPAEAGILSAWVGTTLVMAVTAALAVPLGVAAGL
jgi:phosphate transport system permease protein